MDVSPSELAATVRAQTLSMDNAVAGMAWAVYDYALTVSDEIDYVWRRPIRSGSLLFLWVRYYGLAVLAFKIYANSANNASESNSTEVVALAELLGFALVFSVQVILQTRIYVLYMSKRVATLNGLLFVSEIMLVLYLWGSRRPFECYRAPQCNQVYPLFWIPTIAFEAWIGALAFYQFLLRLRVPRPVAMGGMDILTVFLRDSVIHYVLVIVGIVVFHIMANLQYADSDSGFLQASVFVAGSRLVLHLRRAYYKQLDGRLEDEPDADETGTQLVFCKPQDHGRSRSVMLALAPLDETFWGDDRDVSHSSGHRRIASRSPQPQMYPLQRLAMGLESVR